MSASERKIAELEAEVVKLRHLLSQQMRTGESLEFEAIVRADGTPLVNIRWDELATQQQVEVARDMALNLLRVCEWAEVDSMAFHAIREEFDENAAAGILALLRRGRGGSEERSA